MSVWTDSRSQPGQKTGGADDDRELFMRNFSDDVLEAWEQTFDFDGHTHVRNISAGKSDVFPIIGRKRDADEHIPGTVIKGGGIESAEREISLDAILVDSVFIAEIDELMAHYGLSGPYSRQLGESLAWAANKRIGAALINGSRQTAAPYVGGPVPSYTYDAAMATDASKLEAAAFAGVKYIRENDIGGGQMVYWLPWAQQLLLSRYTGIDSEVTTGSGDRSKASVGLIAGIPVRGTNSIPNTNITTGRTKYQGDFTTTVGVIANPQAVGTLRRRGMKVTWTDQKDRLGTLLIASKLEGHDWLRGECSFEVASATR